MDQPPLTAPSLPPPLPPPQENHIVQESQPPIPNSAIATDAPTPPHPPPQPVVTSSAPPPSAPTPASDRPLNVSDALGYLDEVKNRFQDRPDVYNHFLDIMKDFKGQVLTTPGVIERVSRLFAGHPELISGFNTFLPPGYRIECSTGGDQLITVMTPTGTLTQNAAGALTMQLASSSPAPIHTSEPRPKDVDGDTRMSDPEPPVSIEAPQPGPPAPPPPVSKPSTPHPRTRVSTPQPQTMSSQLPAVPTPRSQTPIAPAQPAHIVLPPPNPAVAAIAHPGFTNPGLVLSPALALNSSTTTASAASVLGGMHRVVANPEPTHPAHPPAAFHPSLPQAQPLPVSTPVPLAMPGGLQGPGFQPPPQTEFNHAIQYINRIKTRFADEPETYKQFLEILQTYQKEQRLLHDVYAQVTQLFRGAPDLIDEFKLFLPDTSANAGASLPPPSFVGTPMPGTGATVGVMGVMGQTGTPGAVPGQAMSTSQAGSGRDTDWTMEVQSVKGEKGAGYRRKVAGSDQNREGPPVKKRRKAPEKEPKTDKEKERERERDRDAVPASNGKVPSRAKKPKHHHSKVAEPSSPPFPPYAHLSSPANALSHPPAHHHSSLPQHQQGQLPPPPPSAQPPPIPPPEVFFDRVKRALDDREVWEEFLKLLKLFSTDVIDEQTLLQLVAPFLGGEGSELEAQFRDIMGVERTRKEDFGDMPKTAGHAHGYGHPTGMGSAYLSGPKFRYGPSYRRLPDSETTLACSGRDELCRSVLNDDWVSHPTWASEESGFVAHKKNSFEEALHKSEEERHEYHVHLESMAHTISLLEPIAYKIGDMTPEERATFRLTPDLGGRSKSIHQKIIKKVYGRENSQEVFLCLQDNPSVAVPVVLDRLKQVDSEWRKNKREWEKVWREVDSRNFYKSLDHQGVAFKANDKKAITSKALVSEIERIKEEQDKRRVEEEEAAMESPSDGPQERAKRNQVLPRHQLQYDMQDETVLQDALKLTLGFLERNDQRQSGSAVPQYNSVERRRIEAFLRHYIMHQFGLGPEFDAVFGPPVEQAEWEDLGLYVADGDEDSQDEDEPARKSRKSGKRSGGSGSGGAVSAGDLKKKLNKTKKAMEKSQGRKPWGTSKSHSNSNSSYHRSPLSSRQASPAANGSEPSSPTRPEAPDVSTPKNKGKGRAVDLDDDVWLRHVELVIPDQAANKPPAVNGVNHTDPQEAEKAQSSRATRHGSFFCNNTFYTLIRLVHLLYSRLMTCKSLAAKLAADRSASFLPNPIAMDLGLTDTAGPSGYFANLGASKFPRDESHRHLKRVAAALTLHLSGHDQSASMNPAEYFYEYLLDLVEKVFDGDLDQTTFEENMRFMFGTRAFVVFTLDKLCAAICKQVQAVVQDGRCHELMNMLEQQRTRDTETDSTNLGVTVQDIIRYRRQAEELVGTDENLFRVDWLAESKRLRIQLLDKDDLSIDPPRSPLEKDSQLAFAAQSHDPGAVSSRMSNRWKQYVQSYVLCYPTEGRRIGVGRKIFLKKTLLEEDANELVDTRWMSDTKPGQGLKVMVGPGTCKLYFTSGCEEAAWRVQFQTTRSGPERVDGDNTEAIKTPKRKGRKKRKNSSDEEQDPDEEDHIGERERLKERAEARIRERRRWIANFDQGLLF